MKTFLNFHGCTALALFMSCLLSLAADPPKSAKPEAKPNRTTDGDPNPWRRRLTDFRADGLPLSEVANALSELFPEVNFVLDPGVEGTMVAFRLKSVTLEDIFTAIGITTQTAGGAIDPVTGMPSQGAIQANKLNDRMVSFTQRQSPAPEPTKPICRAFSLARYLAGKSDDEATKALRDVEEVLELCYSLLRGANSSSAKLGATNLSLHRPTKLLVVVGEPDQIAVVQQVIGQLEGGDGVAGDPTFHPGGGGPAGGFGPPGPPGSDPEVMRAFRTRYGLWPGPTPPPAAGSTNPPAQAK